MFARLQGGGRGGNMPWQAGRNQHRVAFNGGKCVGQAREALLRSEGQFFLCALKHSRYDINARDQFNLFVRANDGCSPRASPSAQANLYDFEYHYAIFSLLASQSIIITQSPTS